MSVSRRFVPTSSAMLEGRLVLSTLAPAPAVGARAAEVRPVHLSPAEVAASNASDDAAGLSVTDTLRAGIPVAKQETITYGNGSTQAESILTVPNLADNTTTTYETIHLRNNGGTETVVDTEHFSGGAQPLSGTDNTHDLTITLPGGSTETETYQEVVTGNKTVVNGTLREANGGTETWTSDKTKVGPKTTTDKTIHEPDGSVEQQKSVTTKQGDLDSTSMTTTVSPARDSFVRSYSATDVTRVQPPST